MTTLPSGHSPAVRVPRRAGPAYRRRGTGSIVLLEPDHELGTEIATELGRYGVSTALCHDALHAAAAIGSRDIDLVVVNATIGEQCLTTLVHLAHAERGLTVLIAHGPQHRAAIGPAVLAGARPSLALPYAMRELLLALGAARRIPKPAARLTVGNLVLDRAGYSVWINERRIDMSALEFELLLVLASQPDAVVSHDFLIRRFWPTLVRPESAMAAVIARLRRKLDRYGLGAAVHAVRGVGYQLDTMALDRDTEPSAPKAVPPRRGLPRVAPEL